VCVRSRVHLNLVLVVMRVWAENSIALYQKTIEQFKIVRSNYSFKLCLWCFIVTINLNFCTYCTCRRQYLESGNTGNAAIVEILILPVLIRQYQKFMAIPVMPKQYRYCLRLAYRFQAYLHVAFMTIRFIMFSTGKI